MLELDNINLVQIHHLILDKALLLPRNLVSFPENFDGSNYHTV